MKIIFGLCGLALFFLITNSLEMGAQTFIQAPSALLVVGATVLFSLANHSFGEIVDAFTKALCSKRVDREDAVKQKAVIRSARTFAITAGALGFVLGTISVMQNLADPTKLGAGVAFAFLATFYALILSEFFLAPLINRLEARAEDS